MSAACARVLCAAFLLCTLVVVHGVEVTRACNASELQDNYSPSSLTLERALQLIAAKGTHSAWPANVTDRIVVMFLEQHNTRAAAPRLKCAVSRLCNGLAHTAFDIFVWTRPDKVAELETWNFPGIDDWRCRLFVMPIQPTSMMMPYNVRPSDVWRGNPPWNSNMFGAEYRLMGRWRLAFSFKFARAIGYEYMLLQVRKAETR